MPTSKIKSIQPCLGVQDNQHRTWKNTEGVTFWKYEAIFEDGTKGEFMSKSDTSPYAIGEELAYEVTKDDPKWGKSLKISKPNSFGGGGFKGGASGGSRFDQKQELCKAVTMSMSYAKDLYVSGKLESGKQMLETFEAIYTRLEAKIKAISA